jgi:hypothetical protein
MIKWVEFHLRKEERVGGDSIDYLSWAKEKKPDRGEHGNNAPRMP